MASGASRSRADEAAIEQRLGAARSAGAVLRALLDNVEQVVLGKRDQIELVVCALLCEGHVLLDDVPGTAKTVLARAIARSVDGATTARIQCTPDLQPTDVTGLSVYDQRERVFSFQPGPVFTNILLVDEINRAMPRTQSALLEAMAERQITVDGQSRALPSPFLILATENPLDHEGVFPLPEAQLDRFFLKAALGYPQPGEELEIVQAQRHGHPLDRLEPVIGIDDLRSLQRAVEDVYIDPLLQQLGDRPRPRDARASRRPHRLVGAWLAGARARRPGDGSAPAGASTSSRRTSSGSSSPCSRIGSSSPTPTRSAARRRTSRPSLLERCLERAPRPGSGRRRAARAVHDPGRRPRLPADPVPTGRCARRRRRSPSRRRGAGRRGRELASVSPRRRRPH